MTIPLMMIPKSVVQKWRHPKAEERDQGQNHKFLETPVVYAEPRI